MLMTMMNNEKIIKTEDGSNTFLSENFNETYHSIKGAVGESMHVFINSGLNFINKKQINIFEVGFGTGLNAILTYNEALKSNKIVNYVTIEKFPIAQNIIENLDYSILSSNRNIFYDLHNSEWNKTLKIDNLFSFKKIKADFTLYEFAEKFDLFFFDAFSYDTQPEMWSLDIMSKIFNTLNKNGVFVTYSSKGIIKQNLRNVGFEVKRLQGYKKRHIIRATKLSGN